LEHKWRWLVAEEERLVELRTAIQCQSEELEERQSVLDKREMALDKSHQSEGDRQLNTSAELGARRKRDTAGEDKVGRRQFNLDQIGWFHYFIDLIVCIF